MQRISRHGFTMIELSIVLVIIGLVLGGIFIASALIEAAQVRSVVSQLNQYDAAVMTFRGKYGGLPGDFNNAVAFGLGDSNCVAPVTCLAATVPTFPGCNGDGNGKLASGNLTPWPDFYQCPESLSFWYHLSQSKLIPEQMDGVSTTFSFGVIRPTPVAGASAPTTRLPNVPIIVNYYIYVIGYEKKTATMLQNYRLTPDQAYQIDSKMDDGLPAAGQMQAHDFSWNLDCYTFGAGDLYEIGNPDGRCSLRRPIPGFQP